MFRTVRVENFYFAILGICMRRKFGHDSARSCSGTMDTLIIPHDDVIKSRHFSRYWPFARGIHRSAVNSPHKGQWRGALMFSMICAWRNGSVNNREAGDLRRHRGHFDFIVMLPCVFADGWARSCRRRADLKHDGKMLVQTFLSKGSTDFTCFISMDYYKYLSRYRHESTKLSFGRRLLPKSIKKN